MKIEKNKVSVVLPIYKVEKFLNECIESIVNQTYKNLEIILVDDESPDNCPQICDDWAKRDNRIKVIHKTNEGLGMARNTGINNATGNYIIFVDSDDKIDLNTIEECCKKLKKYYYDIIYFGFKKINLEGKLIKYYIPTPLKNEYFGESVKNDFFPSLINKFPGTYDFNLNFSACMCLIKLDLIKRYNWKFISEREMISEDVYSLSHLFKYINSVYIINKSFYSYRINLKSITHNYKNDRFIRVKKLYNSLYSLYSENYIKERYNYLFLSYTIACIKDIVNSKYSYINKKKYIKTILDDNVLRNVIKKELKKEEIKRKIFYICAYLKLINILVIMVKIKDIKNSVKGYEKNEN